MQTLTFQNITITPTKIDTQIWLSSSDLAKALGYSRSDSVTRLYNENADEFRSDMTQIIKTNVKGFGNGNSEREIRIFSLRGCHLIAMFARTHIAKEFRVWVLDILDKEVGQPIITPSPTVQSNQLSDKDWTNLKRLVWLCENNFKMQGSAGHAIWARLRAVTGVKSPQKFSREHLPILAVELERIFRMSEQYARARQATERLIIRNVLKYGDDEPMEFFLAEMVEKATDYNQAKAERLPAFFGKELLELVA